MLAFAANRLDHCDREINPWMSGDEDRIIICDRYYLSSLVYQSNEEYSFADVMEVNKKARKPDITIFMNVSNKVCSERMKIRNKPKELFERNLSETRKKYFEAIEFLKTERNENIKIVDASGTIEEVLEEIVETVSSLGPEFRSGQLTLINPYHIPLPNVSSLNGSIPATTELLVKKVTDYFIKEGGIHKIRKDKINKTVTSKFNSLGFNDRGAIFFNYIEYLGYKVGRKFPWTHLDAFELEYKLPGGLAQRGTALLVNENQRYDVIIGSVSQLDKMTDFMFVFSPGPAELVTQYYERGIVKYKNKDESLFPSTKLVTENKLISVIAKMVFDSLTDYQALKKDNNQLVNNDS